MTPNKAYPCVDHLRCFSVLSALRPDYSCGIPALEVVRLFDRYDAGEQAMLVHIFFSQDKDMEDLQEFEFLVSSAGVAALHVVTGSRKAPHAKYFVVEGKAA